MCTIREAENHLYNDNNIIFCIFIINIMYLFIYITLLSCNIVLCRHNWVYIVDPYLIDTPSATDWANNTDFWLLTEWHRGITKNQGHTALWFWTFYQPVKVSSRNIKWFLQKLWTKSNFVLFKVFAKTTWYFDLKLLLADRTFKTAEGCSFDFWWFYVLYF